MTIDPSPALPLPVTIDEIDLAWLTRALRTRAPEAGLRGFEIVEVDHGTCTKIRIALDLDDAARAAGIAERVILKGGFEPHSRQMHYMHGFEVHAYADVLPVLKLPSPAAYFAGFDEARQQGIVILEDLTLRGVEFCHPLVPNSVEQVSRRLIELARFHAKTWGSPELDPGGRWGFLGVCIPETGGHMRQFLDPVVWQSFVDLPRGRAASVHFHDPRWMAEALDKLHRLAKRLPHALLHGDTHLGNLYREADGTPGFFDSLPHRWPGIQEVAYHVAGALDPIERRQAERELVALYLDELAASGVTPPSLEESMRHYAAFLAFGYCIFLVNASAFQPEAINTAYTARFSAAMVDNDTIGVLAALE
ncbi:MAG: hypothetical protein EOO76_00680 [Novosphingobium sp.]|nr:MAG: hypothetical protein EOO76_00680 [Novosphingobium sp.]